MISFNTGIHKMETANSLRSELREHDMGSLTVHDNEEDGVPFYNNSLRTEIPSVRCDTSKEHPKR